MRYCINCGAMNDTDAKYCSGCGKKFDSAPADDTVKTDYTSQQETTYTENETYTDSKTESNTYSYTNQNNAFNYGSNSSTAYNPYRGDGITENKYRGYSIASMILGICSIVLAFLIPFFPLACAIVGLVLGNKAKVYGDNGMAKAGRITSIIGIVLICVFIVLIIIFAAVLGTALINNPDAIEDFLNTYGYLY